MTDSMRERSQGRLQLRVFDGPTRNSPEALPGQERPGTKREAVKALAVLVVDKGSVAPAAKTVGALLAAWLEHTEHRGPAGLDQQAWRRCCQRAGVQARLHDLRHLQDSLVLDAGEGVTTVAARLRHRDTSTTLKAHDHLMPDADTRAAGVVGSALTCEQLERG